MLFANETLAIDAEQIIAKYNLQLLDAFEIVIALAVGCGAFLTNDVTFRAIAKLQVLELNKFILLSEQKYSKPF